MKTLSADRLRSGAVQTFIPSDHISQKLLNFLLKQCPLGNSIWHGREHWIRVLQNGRMLAQLTGANLKVVELFALIHDCRRANEDEDLEHGFKSGDFAKTLHGKWFHIADDELTDLVYACHWHSHGKTIASPTIMTCWDSDRLDLGRVGIRPSPKYLCTDAAKQEDVIQKCYASSIQGL